MWSDQETEQDCLGFAANVEVLAEFCTSERLSPLALGIFGLWGSGKTSLMKMLKKRVEEAQDGKRVLTLWFNAWRYEGREEAQSALIHAIIARLEKEQSLGDELKGLRDQVVKNASVMKLGKFITKSALTMTPDVGGFLECFSNESKKLAESMESFDEDFDTLLERVGIDGIVVFIDDLDRCSSEKVLETFETIKLFLNTPRCTFVVGADPSRIEAAVAEQLRLRPQPGPEDRTRQDYLEKIIQVPFQIPQQNERDIDCYVGMLILGQYLDEGGWEALRAHRPTLYDSADLLAALKEWAGANTELFGDSAGEALEELTWILPHTPILAGGLRGNPRQIKRFLNIVVLRRRLAKANKLEIDQGLAIKLAVIEYTWKDFFHEVTNSFDPGTGQSEMLGELVTKDTAKLAASEESKVLSDAAKAPGLVDFLKAEPAISGKTELSPYLFLAQTSFGATPQLALAPVDETVRDFVGRIAAKDRVMSLAAAKQARSYDQNVVTSVVRQLISEVFANSDELVRTHIVVGLHEICLRHTYLYQETVTALGKLEIDSRSAVCLPATSLLKEASKHTSVPEETIEKYQSDITKALGKKARGRKPRGGR